MKILHILSQAPDFTGSGKFVQELIRQSTAHGHENFLLSGITGDFKLPEQLIKKDRCFFIEFGGKDLAFPIAGMSDVMPYTSTVFSRMNDAALSEYKKVFEQKIRQAVNQFGPDLIHTHHLWIASALVRSVAPDIPMVTTCHGTCLRQHHFCPHISRELVENLNKIDRIIALSPDQKSRIISILGTHPEKIKIISGGFNPAVFYYRPRTFEGTVKLVYAGKLSPTKGVPWLLKSLYHIRGMPFELHIAGSSNDKDKSFCLDLAEKLGPKAIYHGPLTHPELGDLLRKSHIFILPSFFEGVPLVLLEALACGCRIITTALPGVELIFGKGHPGMVKLIDLPELETIDKPYQKDEPMLEQMLSDVISESIDLVAKNPHLDIEYIEKLSSGFTWDMIFDKVRQEYEKLINEK